MKKGLILLGSILSLFTLASCGEQTKVEYIDRVVEVEKPVEVIKEVEVVKEVPVEVEKIVYVDRPVEVEKIVEKEVKVEVPVEKIVEVEKPVYVEKSQVDLNGIDVVKLDDNLYEFEYKAGLETTQLEKMFQNNTLQTYGYFERGELISKPGYIIQNIMLANPKKMATPTILDNDYNSIECSNIDFSQYKAGVAAVKYEYNDINKEQIHISFNHVSPGMSDYYGAQVIRVTFSINYNTYKKPEVIQNIYGYAGLQVNNSDCIYKLGYLGDTVTSQELEDFVLSFYPNCKIVSRNYSKFTTKYDSQKFTTRKIWIEKE